MLSAFIRWLPACRRMQGSHAEGLSYRSVQPNAFATGRNPEHGAIAVTTGLLQIFTKEELEGVIAHELAHIRNRDILIGTVARTRLPGPLPISLRWRNGP